MAEREARNAAAAWTERGIENGRRGVQETGIGLGGRARNTQSTEGPHHRICKEIRLLPRGGSKRICTREGETECRLPLDLAF